MATMSNILTRFFNVLFHKYKSKENIM
jgi:hypothetical protein